MAAVPGFGDGPAVSSIVDEETAREIFERYSGGGPTIEKGDVRDLAYSMGDTLTSDDVDKVFTELDTDGKCMMIAILGALPQIVRARGLQTTYPTRATFAVGPLVRSGNR